MTDDSFEVDTSIHDTDTYTGITPEEAAVLTQQRIINCVNGLSRLCHKHNKTWWLDPSTGEPIDRNKGELLMLIVSELSEAMEGERKDLMDDRLTHRRMAEVELADALIRIFDYAGGYGYDLGGALVEKLQYNAQREDHKPENRLKEGGKKW